MLYLFAQQAARCIIIIRRERRKDEGTKYLTAKTAHPMYVTTGHPRPRKLKKKQTPIIRSRTPL